MEGNHPHPQGRSPSHSHSNDEVVLLMENYKSAMNKQLEKIIDRVISPQKLMECMKESVKKDKEGHIRLFCDATKTACKSELTSRMQKPLEKIRLEALDYAIFKEKYCKAVEECEFNEQQEFLKQLYKSLKGESTRINSLREKEAKMHRSG